MTYDTWKGGLVPDSPHHTQDIKTRELIEQGRHLTLHAYLGANARNTLDVERITYRDNKTTHAPRFELDEYYEER